ncbi:rhomboid family intramembrane serine protease [Echinicola strongylocentroti]|uniref:Rhomboid family intramembrane serine protease n=1 Tax=Echinicola strongylocentroti TaxID=1795355 RepID=A0A2Z4IIV5_9BACT|nr:rhomboid family intramembrane serine protease [Echinicola strongylocentroti]AWW30476.1 rhomboid family intramembrane serine protease [Echinicola strongylocentroti]
MYGGFWYYLKNAFNHKDNSLYKLLAINILVFLVFMVLRVFLTISGEEALYQHIISYFMMPAEVGRIITQPWSILTYMFMHEGIFHILFNMLFLYWFGLLVQEYLGSRKLANLYILGGLAGAVLYVIMYNVAPFFIEQRDVALMLGASAGVYAIVVGAATLTPDTTFHLILLGPVKIKYIAIFYVVIAFANSTGANAGGELAHLGGAALGYFYITMLRKGTDLGAPVQGVGKFFENILSGRPNVKVSYRKKNAPYKSEPLRDTETKNSKKEGTTQEEIDKILDKIADKGYDSLSKEEKRKLFEYSNK